MLQLAALVRGCEKGHLPSNPGAHISARPVVRPPAGVRQTSIYVLRFQPETDIIALDTASSLFEPGLPSCAEAPLSPRPCSQVPHLPCTESATSQHRESLGHSAALYLLRTWFTCALASSVTSSGTTSSLSAPAARFCSSEARLGSRAVATTRYCGIDSSCLTYSYPIPLQAQAGFNVGVGVST